MAASNDPPELPGFYFDRASNRYFRVLPGANNHNPLTQKMISDQKVPTNFPDLPLRRKHNMVKLLQKRSSGMKQNDIFPVDSINSKLNSSTANDVLLQRSYPLGTVCRIQPDCKNERFFEYIGNNSDRLCFYGTMRKHDDVFRVSKRRRDLSFCFMNNATKIMYTDLLDKTIVLLDTQTRNELTVHCRVPLTCAASRTNHFKYVASCNTGSNTILISNVQGFFTSNALHRRGGPGHTFVRLPFTVLCQHFSQTSPIHFNGLRGGSIVGLDMRVLRQKSYCCMLNASAYCNASQIYALRDDHSVLVGYSNREDPEIALWDMRFHKKPAFRFQTSLTRRPKIDPLPLFSLNVDEAELVVTSVLPDCRARFWSLKTGDILSMYPAAGETEQLVTAAAYANNWGLMAGKMGALVYVKEPSYEGYEFLDI